MSNTLEHLEDRQQQFLEERDWEKFHTPKSIAMALSVEANELLELFQWHDNHPADRYEDATEIQDAVEDELADVMIYALSMANGFDVDLESAVEQKLTENETRFDEDTAAEIRTELEKWKQ